MIARLWRGTTRAAQADEYLQYLKRTGVSQCLATPGSRGVHILRRMRSDEADFIFISRWDSREAIAAFAGPAPEKAVYYPEDAAFLLRMDPQVEHYDVVLEEGS